MCKAKPRTNYRLMKSRGFLLIELLVTIAILSTGLVFVLAGFNSSLNALRTSQNIIRASRILEKKMLELERQAEEEEGIAAGAAEGEIDGFGWVREVAPDEETAVLLEDPLWDEEIAPILETALSTVKLSLRWTQGAKQRDISLVTYLESKREEVWEETEE